MSPAERARIAALTRHGRGDTRDAVRPAREAFMARFEQEADPEGLLEPTERAARAQRLLRAHMLRLAAKSAENRRRRAAE
jgi:hypothetical protein